MSWPQKPQWFQFCRRIPPNLPSLFRNYRGFGGLWKMTKPSWIRWNYRTTNAFTKQTNGTPTIQYSICMVWYNYKSCSMVLLSKAIPKLPTKNSMVGRSSRFFSWGLLKAYFQKGLMLVTRGTWLRRSGSSLCVFCGLFFRSGGGAKHGKDPWKDLGGLCRAGNDNDGGESAVQFVRTMEGVNTHTFTESLRVYLGFGSSHIFGNWLID